MAKPKSPLVWIVAGVGCLGFLVVVGIIAIVLPNFFSARERARRAQTFAAMREVALALDTYSKQNGRFPPASSIAELAKTVQSAQPLPKQDAWGHEFRYHCWPAAPAGCEHYSFASAGKDGVFERDDLSTYPGEQTPVRNYDRDIVMLDGNFLQYPGSR